MRILTILLALPISTLCLSDTPSAEDVDACSFNLNGYGAQFILGISRSLHDDVEFRLCRPSGSEAGYLLVTTDFNLQYGLKLHVQRIGEEPVDKFRQHKVELSAQRFEQLVHLYNDALSYNVRDAYRDANDGSVWCLISLDGRYEDRRGCFYSPAVNSDARNLADLFNLGNELWNIASPELSIGGIY